MTDTTEKHIAHPIEKFFDIEEGTTALPVIYEPKQNIEHAEYDSKDKEIENQYQEIFNAAMEAFHSQSETSQIIDPKFKAGSQEIAVQFLSTALNAVSAKANLKNQKEKNVLAAKKSGPKTVNQNIIVDRNDLLKLLSKDNDEQEVISGEFQDLDYISESEEE